MLSCWYFKLASSTNSLAVDPAAISANRSCSCLRCSGFSTLSTISTPVGLPPLPKTLLALAWALAASSVVERMNSSLARPVVPLPMFFRCKTLPASRMATLPSIRYS